MVKMANAGSVTAGIGMAKAGGPFWFISPVLRYTHSVSEHDALYGAPISLEQLVQLQVRVAVPNSAITEMGICPADASAP
jgi:hypothetical protein